MATDGEPAEPFIAREGRLMLGPGNRIDVFVDCALAPGAAAQILAEHTNANGVIDGSNAIGRIVCDADAARRATPRKDPQSLPPNPLPARMDFAGAARADVVAGRDAPRAGAALFSVKRGRTVMLKLSNPTSESRFIHLHGHHFRLLDALDDGWKPFWLDTMPLAPASDSRIAFVADNPGKWEIEGVSREAGPVTWFEVH
jgi:FtsP/CotA-like multicopper oxidase with cupredoxin domain